MMSPIRWGGVGLVGLLCAQGNAFGGRLGISLYQYRTDLAQFYARFGAEVGAVGRIVLFKGRKSKLHHAFMPGFGYLMGHSKLLLDSAIYISPLSGRPLTGVVEAHAYTHYLYLQGLWRISFDAKGAFAVGAGGQVLYPLGQTLMLEYQTPDGQPLQEWNSVALSNVRKVIPPWILNASLYAELRLREGLRSESFLYLQTLHQVNRYLWPTGLLVGASWLWKSQSGN